ncbi:MAG: DUF2058 domain-containing protein [Gammaproteobacteria bacterium]|nr:DUF2058 domain-containing protein [Gammaproteobacteria bacterium]
MAGSLFDQLKKSGLVDTNKAKQISREKHQSRKQADKGKNKAPQLSEAALLAQQAQAEKEARDRELNRQQKAEIERRAIAAQIRQLIEQHRIKNRDGDVAYNFNNGGKVDRVYVTATFQAQLAKGQLAIVKLDQRVELVPTVIAEKIRQRDEGCVLYCDSVQHEEKQDDDPYANYQIPDDLMW